ncbi:hypothetical protein ACFSUJ_33375 [Streptomyces lusitanus]|uniref:Uncharacterized protein n=1 Tax=Streptomyces lusitanus TaxID=68232 RepID=A0ABU3JTN7_9ACTN|nr:hypothetical protein [Streptomyces lusitanus]
MTIDTVSMARTSGCPVAWLVGLPFRSATARAVRFYYVVADAEDDEQAVRVALERADRDRDGNGHDRQLSPGTPIEVQRVLRDLLGNTSLT